MILPAALLTPVQYFMPSAVLFTILGIPKQILLFTALTMVGPVITTITPYRLRGMGSALASVYIFFIGATGGAVLSALLSDAFGPRAAVLLLAIPSTVVGGTMILRGAKFIRNDLSLVVAELREELDEHERRIAARDAVPALQVVDVDFSYGPVQVLFGVGFEVRRGEVLALLGTNFGRESMPAWVLNLTADPRATVTHGDRTVAVRSRPATPAEEAEVLTAAARIYPGYDRYRERISGRAIPVLVLEESPT